MGWFTKKKKGETTEEEQVLQIQEAVAEERTETEEMQATKETEISVEAISSKRLRFHKRKVSLHV